MQSCNFQFYLFLSILFALPSFNSVSATEFTFDLQDSAEECFFEVIPENTNCTLEYHVRWELIVNLRKNYGIFCV